MLKSIVKTSFIFSIVSVIMAMPVMSYSPFSDQAADIYKVRTRCEVCHQGTELNSFGKDFSVEWSKSHDIVKSYKSVENLDSDNDGFLNADEIRAMSLPGDKTSVPHIQSTVSIKNTNKITLRKSH